jgi:hypothetical protein
MVVERLPPPHGRKNRPSSTQRDIKPQRETADATIMSSVGGSEIRSAAEGAASLWSFGSAMQAASQGLVGYRCGGAPVLNRLSPDARRMLGRSDTLMLNFTVQS